MDNENLKAIEVKKHTIDYEKVKETLSKAFPKREQSPIWALRLMAKHKCVDFFAYYDSDENYIGTSYSIHDNKKLLILYLATDENIRGKGYGTKIIKYLQSKDNIEETVVDIESIYEESDNKEQRFNRLKFYKRLGFISSDYEIIEPSCHYLILGTAPKKERAVNTYKELTALLTSNLLHLNIKERKS